MYCSIGLVDLSLFHLFVAFQNYTHQGGWLPVLLFVCACIIIAKITLWSMAIQSLLNVLDKLLIQRFILQKLRKLKVIKHSKRRTKSTTINTTALIQS